MSLASNPKLVRIPYELRSDVQLAALTQYATVNLREALLASGMMSSPVGQMNHLATWALLLRFDDLYNVSNQFLVPSATFADTISRYREAAAETFGEGIGLVLARSLFDVAFVANFETYLESNEAIANVTRTSTRRRRPDFIMFTRATEWFLLEAKGTFGPSLDSKLSDGKRQVQNWALSGVPTAPSMVAATTMPKKFPASQQPYVIFADPEASEPIDVPAVGRSIVAANLGNCLKFFGFVKNADDIVRGVVGEEFRSWLHTLPGAVEIEDYVVLGDIDTCRVLMHRGIQKLLLSGADYWTPAALSQSLNRPIVDERSERGVFYNGFGLVEISKARIRLAQAIEA